MISVLTPDITQSHLLLRVFSFGSDVICLWPWCSGEAWRLSVWNQPGVLRLAPLTYKISLTNYTKPREQNSGLTFNTHYHKGCANHTLGLSGKTGEIRPVIQSLSLWSQYLSVPKFSTSRSHTMKGIKPNITLQNLMEGKRKTSK